MLSHVLVPGDLEADAAFGQGTELLSSPNTSRSKRKAPPVEHNLDPSLVSPAKKPKARPATGSESPSTPRRKRDAISPTDSHLLGSSFFSSPPTNRRTSSLFPRSVPPVSTSMPMPPDLDQRKLELLEARLLGRPLSNTTPKASESQQGSAPGSRSRGKLAASPENSSRGSSPSRTPRVDRRTRDVLPKSTLSNDATEHNEAANAGQAMSPPARRKQVSGVMPVPTTAPTRASPRLSVQQRTSGAGGPSYPASEYESSEESESEGSSSEAEVEEPVSFEGEVESLATPAVSALKQEHSQVSSHNGRGIVLQMTDSMMQDGDDGSQGLPAVLEPSEPGSRFRGLLDGLHGAPAPSSAYTSQYPTPTVPKSAPLPLSQEKPSKRSKKFTEAEDQLLSAAIAKFGTDWDEVAKAAFPNGDRTAEQVKSRWKRLGRKKKADEGAAAETSPPGQQAMSIDGGPLAPQQPQRSAIVDLTSPLKPRSSRPGFQSPHEDFGSASASASAAASPTKPGKPGQSSHQARPIYEYFARREGFPVPQQKPTRFESDAEATRREGELKAQSAQLMGRLQEQDTMLSGLQNQLQESERQRDDLVRRHQQFRAEAEAKISEAHEGKKAQLERSRAILGEMLVTQAREKGREKRRRCNENSLRLASMTVERHGMELQERWEEGYEFQEVEDKISRIAQEKEEIEKRRKILTKRRNLVGKASTASSSAAATNDGVFAVPETPASAASKGRKSGVPRSGSGTWSAQPGAEEDMSPLSLQDYMEQDEILKLRIIALKKEEAELNTNLGKLQVERNAHVRELRRIRDENASRFNNHPMLNERYLLMELLGRGGFSEVWKAWDLNEMVVVAVKIHSLNSQWGEDRKRSYTRHAIREYRIHKQLVHSRIIRLWDVFEIDDTSFATVLDFNDGVDLETYLQTVKVVPEREARSIITQIVSALKYLNELPKPVIHYDLKPGNILLSNGEVRITDFGLSKILEPANEGEGAAGDSGLGGRREFGAREMELTSQGAGTYWYLPPEVFERTRDGAPKISSKVDVWSLGVIYYEILFGEKPFANDKSQQSILRTDTITMEAHSLVFPAKPTVSQETKDFIRKLLEYRKDKRPDVLTVASDPYINVALSKQGSGR